MTLLDRLAHAVVPGRRRRRVWHHESRSHIEVRAVHRTGTTSLVEDLEAALDARDDVRWARVYPVLGRVVVDHTPGVDIDDLIRVVAELEDQHGVASEPLPIERQPHPGDPERVAKQQAALGANVAGLGFAVAGRLARFARLPVELSSAIGVVQNQPRLRAGLESVVGTTATDLGLGLVGATSSALAQGPFGLLVDGVHRGLLLTEAVATAGLWRDVEPELFTHDHPGGDALATSLPRHRATGPAATYADRAGLAQLGAGVATFVATRNPRRAAGVSLAGTPKAARLGMDAFASLAARDLSRRRVLVMDGAALRRTDQIDTLLLDGRVLVANGRVLDRVVVLGDDQDTETVHRRARGLFRRLEDDATTGGRITEDGWELCPGRQLHDELVAAQEAGDLADVEVPLDGPDLLGLRHDDTLTAVIVTHPALRKGAVALVELAREADLHVAVTDPDDVDGRPGGWLAARLRADEGLGHRLALADAVGDLQTAGRHVGLVAAAAPDAHVLAELSVGVRVDGADVPWGADILCGPGLDDVHHLVDLVAVAREISRQSAALALGGSGVGSLLALTGRGGATDRGMAAVNAAAVLALANGVRAGVQLGRQQVELLEEPPLWHELEPDEVLEILGTDAAGLSSDDVQRRQDALGVADREQPSLVRSVLDELANPLTPVLAAGASLSAAVGSVTDAALVSGVVGLDALVGGVQRFRVDRVMQRLQETAGTLTVCVRRDGQVVDVPAEDLVPGDVMELASGDAVAADARLLEADSLELDESSLTGESLPVAKDPSASFAAAVADRTSMLYAGTTVATGTAVAVVVAVGDRTEAGIAHSDEVPTAAGVEARLAELSRVTLPIAAAGGALVTGAGLIRGQGLSRSLAPGVNLAVAAVPEGLPLLANLAQMSAAGRLSKRGALARNPRALEALGRLQVLCIDKTGTLTQGRIELARVHDGTTHVALDDVAVDGGTRFTRIVAAGLRASPVHENGEALPHQTDRAVVNSAQEHGLTTVSDVEHWERVDELPFKPERSYHAVLGSSNGNDGLHLSVKGAPEVVLEACDWWVGPDGEVELDDATRDELRESADQMARDGYRVLAVAERPTSTRRDLAEERIDQLRLLGFLGLADPVRPEAAQAVRTLLDAGIRVVMATGDHPSTADGIARELNILNGGRVVTGVELDEFDDDELDAVLDEVTVFARVTPAHKVRIVEAYQRRDIAVGMTGDGANDAPAIRLADIGIALGEGATPAARAAADLVVPDGRIETIIDAVIEGRGLWRSVREALGILLGGNLGEIAFTVTGSLVSGRPPVSARQLLLVNLMTDVAPGLAVAVRRPRGVAPEDLLAEGPDVSLGRKLERQLAVRATTTAAGAGAAWTLGRLTGRPRRAGTIGLVALVGTQLGQTLVAGRTDPVVAAAGIGSAVALGGIVQTPGVSHFFGCTPLGPVGWGIALGSASGATLVSAVASPLLDRLGIWTPETDPSSGHGSRARSTSSLVAGFGHRVGEAIHAVVEDDLVADVR